MAIQIPNPGTGNGATGDNEFVLWSKVKDNFSNTTHAASRLVGTAPGNVMEVGAFGFGTNERSNKPNFAKEATTEELKKTQMVSYGSASELEFGGGLAWSAGNIHYSIIGGFFGSGVPMLSVVSALDTAPNTPQRTSAWKIGTFLVLDFNVTKDANGFLKGASPIAEIYSDKIDLNQDAIKQGGITFEKLGVGDYLVKGSLGFAQEGWYIETPKDANGNVLVAVVYEQLANNDLSIKTYAKKFDDETGDIVANLTKPRDIPTGRFISLRLHELPKEPPVMPTETQTEV